MPAKKAQKTFRVEARVVVITSQPVVAASLEAALEVARTMDVTDFVDVLGEHNDSSIRIASVSSENDWKHRRRAR